MNNNFGDKLKNIYENSRKRNVTGHDLFCPFCKGIYKAKKKEYDCPYCNSSIEERSILHFLLSSFDFEKEKILFITKNERIYNYLEKNNTKSLFLFENKNLDQIGKNEFKLQTFFNSYAYKKSFDRIICHEILDLVIQEGEFIDYLKRLKKKDGSFIILNNIDFNLSLTKEISGMMTAKNRSSYFEKDAVYRVYGRDFINRMSNNKISIIEGIYDIVNFDFPQKSFLGMVHFFSSDNFVLNTANDNIFEPIREEKKNPITLNIIYYLFFITIVQIDDLRKKIFTFKGNRINNNDNWGFVLFDVFIAGIIAILGLILGLGVIKMIYSGYGSAFFVALFVGIEIVLCCLSGCILILRINDDIGFVKKTVLILIAASIYLFGMVQLYQFDVIERTMENKNLYEYMK